jgi:subtilisin family serine protease
MRVAVIVVALFLIAGAAPKTAAAEPIDASALSSALVPREVVVQFRHTVARSEVRGLHAARATRLLDRASAPGLGRVDVVLVPRGRNVFKVAARYERSPLVVRAEPNFVRRLFAAPDDPRWSDQWGLDNIGQPHAVADWDPSVRLNVATGAVDADSDVLEAWEQHTAAAEPVIAVVDSGVDVTHPDLVPTLWVNPGEVAGNGIDDDGNGYRDDVHGWDFAGNDATLIESNENLFGWDHGTHVAGIAAAAANNAEGIAGVCPVCKIMVLKVGVPIDADPRAPGNDTVGIDLFAEIEALDYAARMGADIANLSFGIPVLWSGIERAAIRSAGRAGVLVVAAAGNGNGDNDVLEFERDFDGDGFADSLSPMYPASYDLSALVAVAATNHNDEYAYSTECEFIEGSPNWPCAFTNLGRRSVDLAAPGVDVVSTLPHGTYGVADGTSMASPLTAAVAGLVKSMHPAYGPSRLKGALLGSVDKPGSLGVVHVHPTRDHRGRFTVTNGRVNALASLGPAAAMGDDSGDWNIHGARRLRRRVTGRVAWPGDVNDVFRKRLVKGERYEVGLNGPSDRNIDLWVWKPRAKEIWQIEEGCLSFGRCAIATALDRKRTGEESTVLKARSTGPHYFQVTAPLFGRGSYALTVARI